jgi:hypothetical protein
MAHPLNYQVGLWLILGGFVSGAIVGLRFHREDYLGGYGSFRRRLVRLGHIAFVALGFLNLVFGLSPVATALNGWAPWTGRCLMAGSLAMPTVCLFTAWKPAFRHLFFIPVSLLAGAVVLWLVFLPV